MRSITESPRKIPDPTAKVLGSTAAMARYSLDVGMVLCGAMHDLV